jgi:hypothetical protein
LLELQAVRLGIFWTTHQNEKDTVTPLIYTSTPNRLSILKCSITVSKRQDGGKSVLVTLMLSVVTVITLAIGDW